MHRSATLMLLAALLASCTPAARSPAQFAVREVTPDFLLDVAAADPSLATGDAGRVALTWVTRTAAGGADVFVSVSHDSGGHWTPPQRLNPTPGRVSSFTESRPVAAFGDGGELVVTWAARRDSGEFADDIVARASADGGLHFGPTQWVNDDAGLPSSTYHGFMAVESLAGGAFMAAWIDGRAAAARGERGEPAAGEIWAAISRDGGRTWAANTMLADSVCACCRIELRARGDAVALAYRGLRGGLRDPRLALSSDGGATFALDTLVSRDAWRLAGCPSHGPSVALTDGGGEVAWYTAGAARARGTWFAGWSDDGRTASPVPLANGLHDVSRPRLAGTGDACWLAVLGTPAADSARVAWAVAPLGGDGAPGPWTLLGARARSGALAAADSRGAWAAWTEDAGAGPRLRVARVGRR